MFGWFRDLFYHQLRFGPGDAFEHQVHQLGDGMPVPTVYGSYEPDGRLRLFVHQHAIFWPIPLFALHKTSMLREKDPPVMVPVTSR